MVNDGIVWAIVVGFYAPLHFLMPMLVLFITGKETAAVRKRLLRNSFIDSSVSLVVAFAVAIMLVQRGRILPAMVILLLSMAIPFVRIWRHRREIGAAD